MKLSLRDVWAMPRITPDDHPFPVFKNPTPGEIETNQPHKYLSDGRNLYMTPTKSIDYNSSPNHTDISRAMSKFDTEGYRGFGDATDLGRTRGQEYINYQRNMGNFDPSFKPSEFAKGVFDNLGMKEYTPGKGQKHQWPEEIGEETEDMQNV
jgi:hypothetical protein